jgi:site-specific recombinase XerD
MDRSDVEAYVAELTRRKERGEIKQAFVKDAAKNIKYFAEWLMDEEILDPKEFHKIERDIKKIPGGDIGEDNREALSDEEEKQIFNRLNDVLLQMLAWSGENHGFRRLEYCNLRVKNLELDRKEPRLKIECSKGHRKKTRYIPLFPGQVAQWLKWLNFRASLNLSHDFVFFDPKNPSKPLTKDSLGYLFQKISKISKVHVYSHRLRYTYAVRLWEHGVDIYTISRLLGHSKVETTIRYLKVPERNFLQKFMESAKGLFY